MYSIGHAGKRKSSSIDATYHDNKKAKLDNDRHIDHANKKFIERMQCLVECKFYLKTLGIDINDDEDNKKKVLQELENNKCQLPVVIKSGKKYWLYAPATYTSNGYHYFACLELDDKNASYLAALFNNDLLATGEMTTIESPTFEVCKISNAINVATEGKVDLTKLKSLMDSRYYSLCLVVEPSSQLTELLRKNNIIANDREKIYKELLGYASDERRYPNTVIIKLNDGRFWFYYNKLNDPNDFILQEIATKFEDKAIFNNFFVKHAVTCNNKKLIIDLDDDAKRVDKIIEKEIDEIKRKGYFKQHIHALWQYYKKKEDGYTDGFLLKDASGIIHLCKARLHSYDFNIMELKNNNFEYYKFQDGNTDQSLKDKFPLLIKDKNNDFIFCILYDYGEFKIVKDPTKMPSGDQVKAGEIYISINQEQEKQLVYTIRHPNGRIVLRNQKLPANIILQPGEQINDGRALKRLRLDILKAIANEKHTYQGTQALEIKRFKHAVDEDKVEEDLEEKDLAFITALFQVCVQACEINKYKKNILLEDEELIALIAMQVNLEKIKEDISGGEIYKILERRFGYSRPPNEYQWYFYELFSESVGSELFSYILGKLVPVNQLISIPGEAPGLVSKYFSGDFSTLEGLRNYLAQYDNDGNVVEPSEESKKIIDYFLTKHCSGEDIASLSQAEKGEKLKQFILEQDNIGMIIAATCFLSDIDGKFANMGMILEDGCISMVRVDFGTTFANLYDHLHVMQIYLLGLDEKIDGKSYESNNNYSKIYGDLLKSEKFRVALLEISKLDIEHLAMLVEKSVARFMQAWRGIEISEASVIRLCTHLFGNDEAEWPEGASRDYFVDKNNKVYFSNESVQRITNVIKKGLEAKKVFFGELSETLKHAQLFETFTTISKSIKNITRDIKDFDIEDIFINLDKNKSDRRYVKIIAQCDMEAIAEAINFIEKSNKDPANPTAQTAVINSITDAHYWIVIACFTYSLGYVKNVEEMFKKYNFLLEKLNNYPYNISNEFKGRLLNFAVKRISYKIMKATNGEISGSYPYLIYRPQYSILDDKLREKTAFHNNSNANVTSTNLRKYYCATAYLCFAGQKEEVNLPIDEHEVTACSIATAQGLDLAEFRVKALSMEDGGLVMDDYSAFVDFVNELTDIRISVQDIMQDFNSESNIIMQLCIAATKGNISKIKMLMSELIRKSFANNINDNAFLNIRLLALHVAIIKNQKEIVEYLVSDLYGGDFFGLELTLGSKYNHKSCAALQRALIVNNNDGSQSQLTLLHEFARTGNNKSLAKLLKNKIINNFLPKDANGQTPLHLAISNGHHTTAATLIEAMFYWDCKVLIQELEADEKMLCKLSLNASTVTQYGVGPNVLWFLVNAVSKHYSDKIVKHIRQLTREVLEKIDFDSVASSELEKGATLLWLVVAAEFEGKIKWLADLVENAGNKIANSNLNASPKRGVSVLYMLSQQATKALRKGYSILDKIINVLCKAAAFTKLIELDLNARDKEGKTVLWNLAYAFNKGCSDSIVTILKAANLSFVSNLELSICPMEGGSNGVTPLWLLTNAAYNGKSEALQALSNKLHSIKASDLNNAPMDYSHECKDVSVLWLLLSMAANGKLDKDKSDLLGGFLKKLPDEEIEKLNLDTKFKDVTALDNVLKLSVRCHSAVLNRVRNHPRCKAYMLPLYNSKENKQSSSWGGGATWPIDLNYQQNDRNLKSFP